MIRHEAVLVTGWDIHTMLKVRQIAVQVFADTQHQPVSPLSPIMSNDFSTFVIVPDGYFTNEDARQDIAKQRSEFVDALEATKPLGVSWAVVGYGDTYNNNQMLQRSSLDVNGREELAMFRWVNRIMHEVMQAGVEGRSWDLTDELSDAAAAAWIANIRDALSFEEAFDAATFIAVRTRSIGNKLVVYTLLNVSHGPESTWTPPDSPDDLPLEPLPLGYYFRTDDMAEFCRPEVKRFAIMMEERLRANDDKAGWSDSSHHELINSLWRKVAQLGCRHPADIPTLATDAGNYAMMVSENADRLMSEVIDSADIKPPASE